MVAKLVAQLLIVSTFDIFPLIDMYVATVVDFNIKFMTLGVMYIWYAVYVSIPYSFMTGS